MDNLFLRQRRALQVPPTTVTLLQFPKTEFLFCFHCSGKWATKSGFVGVEEVNEIPKAEP
jgi:hypothetical protein